MDNSNLFLSCFVWVALVLALLFAACPSVNVDDLYKKTDSSLLLSAVDAHCNLCFCVISDNKFDSRH